MEVKILMKFYGSIGFWKESFEVAPDVYKSAIEERLYFGDVLKNRRGWRQTENQNDDFTVTNRISILSDLYAQQNWTSIRYINWNGVKWKVTNIEVAYPRLNLEIGGIWNGPESVIVEPTSS